jgi:hypothetical protein
LSLELLLSASYEASQAASEKRFEGGLRTNHLRLNFRPSYRFSTTSPASEQTVELIELLIPISASSLPDYVFMRERGRLRAFAKYHRQSAQALQEMLKQQ